MNRMYLFLLGMILLSGCVHVSTSHQVGDKLRLKRDVYVLESERKESPEIALRVSTENGEIYKALPKEVAQENIGKQCVRSKITDVLGKDTILEVVQFDLKWSGGYTYNTVILKSITDGRVFDLSDSLLLDCHAAKNAQEFVLSPIVFQSLETRTEK